MATLQQLKKMIDEILAFLDSNDQTRNDEMDDLAKRYATECRLANVRLSRCVDFLEQGLWAPTVALAEVEPDLLRVVEILDFAKRPQWLDLIMQYDGLERAQPLKLDVRDRVVKAFEYHRNIEGRLRRHRRLALAQAPLKERLQVMREIASADPLAPYWRDDIAEMKRYRVVEIAGALARAKQSGNVGLLRQCMADYESESWTVAPPDDFAEEYRKLVRFVQTTTTLPEIAQNIAAAFQRLDLHALHDHRAHWDQTTGQLSQNDRAWSPPARLQMSVAPAFQWMDQQLEVQRGQAFWQDVAQLESAIRSDAGKDQIELLFERVRFGGFQVPQATQALYEQYQRGDAREKWLWKAVIVALALAGITALVFGFFMLRVLLKK
jgi:hypothetical protein